MSLFDHDRANAEMAEIISRLLEREDHERHEIERLNELLQKVQEDRHGWAQTARQEHERALAAEAKLKEIEEMRT